MLAIPIGTVLSAPQPVSVSADRRIKTAEGATLEFHGATPQADVVACPAALSIRVDDPSRDQLEDYTVATIAYVLTDAEGSLWQVSRPISNYEIARSCMLEPEYFETISALNPAGIKVEDLKPPLARPLTPTIRVAVDDRSSEYKEVVRTLPETRPGVRNTDALLFRISTKYSGCEVRFFEQVTKTFSNGKTYVRPGITAVLTMMPDFDSIPLDSGPRTKRPETLMQLCPLLAYDIKLKPRFSGSDVSPPTRADAHAWAKAMADAGMSAADIERVLAPNSAVRVIHP